MFFEAIFGLLILMLIVMAPIGLFAYSIFGRR